MHYNSIDQFLSLQEATLAGIAAQAQERAGGHYARMTPEERQHNALSDIRYIAEILRSGQFDRADGPKIARQADSQGVELDDLTRMVDELMPALVRYVEETLREQPDLRAALVRRIRHSGTSYRGGVTQVKLDKTLDRFRTA